MGSAPKGARRSEIHSVFGKYTVTGYLTRLFLLATWFGLALMSASGCDTAGRSGTEDPTAVTSGQPSVLKMLVVDDPDLAAETGRRWAAEGRYDLLVETCTEQEIRDKKYVVAADIDLLVMPANLEAEFVTAGQLVAIPASTLDSPAFSQMGLLPHFRGILASLDGRQYSMPLGAPQAMLLIHESLARQPGFSAQAWDSLQQAVTAGGEPGGSTDVIRKFVYPDSGNWLAWSLIARASSTVRASDDRSMFFVADSMEPMIDTPGYVEALEKMCAEAAETDPDSPRSPADVYRMVLEGKALAGIGWPSPLENGNVGVTSIGSVFASRLPGSTRRYSRKQGEWTERLSTEQQQFDVLGIDGRCVGVTTASLHAGAALELASWMCNQSSSVLCSRSAASGPFRKSHLADPVTWLGVSIAPDAVGQWASAIDESHSAPLPVVFPALEGRDEYLNALSNAVRQCLDGEKTAQDALKETAAAWSVITEKHGVENQRIRNRWRKH